VSLGGQYIQKEACHIYMRRRIHVCVTWGAVHPKGSLPHIHEEEDTCVCHLGGSTSKRKLATYT
jgi:hypothetical protein